MSNRYPHYTKKGPGRLHNSEPVGDKLARKAARGRIGVSHK